MNDGSTEVQQNKAFSLPINIKTRVISDVTTTMKTFRAKRRLGIRYRVLGPELHGV